MKKKTETSSKKKIRNETGNTTTDKTEILRIKKSAMHNYTPAIPTIPSYNQKVTVVNMNYFSPH